MLSDKHHMVVNSTELGPWKKKKCVDCIGQQRAMLERNVLIPGPLTWVRGLRGWHRQYRPGHQAQRARTTTQLGAAASGPSSSGRRMRPLVPTPPSPPCSTSTPTFLTFARTFQVSLSRITVFYLWILFCCDVCLTGMGGGGGGGFFPLGIPVFWIFFSWKWMLFVPFSRSDWTCAVLLLFLCIYIHA